MTGAVVGQPAPGAYIGLEGYAAALAELRWPSSSNEVADRLGFGRGRMRSLLKQFHALGLIHRVGWVRPGVRGYDQPVYRLGRGVDVLARLTAAGEPMPHADFKPAIWPKVQKLADVVAALEVGPCTVYELEEGGPHRHTLYRLMAHMHALRLVHVAAWERRADGAGAPIALYRYGAGPDAPRPKPRPHAERVRCIRVRVDARDRSPWDGMVLHFKREARAAAS